MAGSIIRKFTKWFFISLNILVCVVFLIGCLSLFINPNQWGIIGFLALTIPYLAALLVFSVIFWLIVKPIVSLIPILTLAAGWKQLIVICAWHPLQVFNSEIKTDSTLRIITWNVRGMYGISNSGYTQRHNRHEIAALVNKLNADIICLQEFSSSTNPLEYNANNIGLFTEKCPNYFFPGDYKNNSGTYCAGTILFSRYPIIDTGKTKLLGPNSESLIYADIVKRKDTIRVFTMHLQSFEFTGSDYADLQKMQDPNSEALKASEKIYSKMKPAFKTRGIQADVVRAATNKSPYPSIVCGDFNDVPNSYTYFHIRGNRQDAFLSSAFGVGRSFNALAPTLRIDYILPDKHFNIQQFDMVDEGLSDHHLLVADISLKK